MKLALLSDIHANIQALDACITHARAQGQDGLPCWVISWVMAQTLWRWWSRSRYWSLMAPW